MDITAAFTVFQAVTLAIQLYLMVTLFRSRGSRDSTYECDSQYLEITKLMIENDDLLDFYAGSVAGWEEMPAKQRKLFLLFEMNYFHLAFAHREHVQGRLAVEHWSLYADWVKRLAASNDMFNKVHEANRTLFEKEFVTFVDDLSRPPRLSRT